MAVDSARLTELIKKAQSGDKEAYLHFLQETSAFLLYYVSKKITIHSDTEEVVQEVLLAIHKALHTYDSTRNLMSWILAITEYKINDFLRYQYKHRLDVDLEMAADVSFTKNDIINSDLHKAIDQLGEIEKEVITLLKFEGLKISEVASKLNLTEANVKVLSHRSIKKLQEIMGSKNENR